MDEFLKIIFQRVNGGGSCESHVKKKKLLLELGLACRMVLGLKLGLGLGLGLGLDHRKQCHGRIFENNFSAGKRRE